MSEKGGKGWIVVVIVVAGLCALGYPYLKWFQLEMDIRSQFEDKHLGRHPGQDKMIGMKDLLLGMAKMKGFDDTTVALRFEERSQGAVIMRYFGATISSGSRSFYIERRVETPRQSLDFDKLKEAGFALKVLGPGPEKDEDD